jgi:predicted transcriptional regulator
MKNKKNELVISEKGTPPILKNNIDFINPRKSKYKLTIRKVTLPENDDFNEQFAFICATLGFFEDIDKNKVAARIFREIFLASYQGQVLTSTSIANRIGMSRGSTISHLNSLTNAGLIEKGGKYYFTRHRSMNGIIEEIEDDLSHIFDRAKKIAESIDEKADSPIIMD